MPLFFRKRKPSEEARKRLEYQMCLVRENGFSVPVFASAPGNRAPRRPQTRHAPSHLFPHPQRKSLTQAPVKCSGVPSLSPRRHTCHYLSVCSSLLDLRPYLKQGYLVSLQNGLVEPGGVCGPLQLLNSMFLCLVCPLFVLLQCFV